MLLLPRKRADDEESAPEKYGHDSCADEPRFVGGFAEYCYIMPGTCVVKVPDQLTDEEAAPANCALATVVAGWEAADRKPFENVLIQGAGALGFYSAALAKHHGCKRVIVTDILEHRLAAIKEFGATDTINTREMKDDELVRAVCDLTDGFGVGAAMEVAGVPVTDWGRYWHTHVIPSVADLPELIEKEFS